MTNTRQIPVFLSANATFKGNYGKYLRWSMLAAVILMSLLVWMMPRYEPTPYVLRETVIHIYEIQEIPEFTKEEEPVAAPPIARELEAVDDGTETTEEFPDLVPWVTWTPEPTGGGSDFEEEFTPSSSNPRLLFQAKPHYPQIARMSGIEGTVIVKILVGKRGDIAAVVVVESIHPLLDQEAVQAAFRCRFSPGTQRAIPVKAWVAVPYRFRLH